MGSTTSGGAAARSGSSAASVSSTSTVAPTDRSASATRRPERSETSRSWDRPPARTTTTGAALTAARIGHDNRLLGIGRAARVQRRGLVS